MRPASGSAGSGATHIALLPLVGTPWIFISSPKHNVAAAKRFLTNISRSTTQSGDTRVISTDKAQALAKAISKLKTQGIFPPTVEHRRIKYLNNVIEDDHGLLKRILGPKGAFKNRTSTYRTPRGWKRCTHHEKARERCSAEASPTQIQ